MRLEQRTLLELMDDDGPFAPSAAIGEEARDMGMEELHKAYDDVIAGMLRGLRMPTGVLDLVRRNQPVSIDRITAEIVLHMGLDPIAAATISSTLEDVITILDANDAPVAYVDTARWGGVTPFTVALGAGVWWSANGISAPLPTAACATLPGRTLSEVVSHQILDRHPLRIVDAEQDANGVANITFGHTLGLLTHQELVDMRDRRFYRDRIDHPRR